MAGVVIGGNAAINLHDFYFLTSPSFPADSASTLRFLRWLNSDYTPYMQNVVDVYNGAIWVRVWASGGSPAIADSSWETQSIDVSAYRSGAMRVRFGFNVLRTGVWSVSSWNLASVRVN